MRFTQNCWLSLCGYWLLMEYIVNNRYAMSSAPQIYKFQHCMGGLVVMIPSYCTEGPEFNPSVGNTRIFKVDFNQQNISSLWRMYIWRVPCNQCTVPRQVKDPGYPWMNRVCASLIISSLCLPLAAGHISRLSFRSVAEMIQLRWKRTYGT